jgi:hypothetical protein
MRIRPVFLRLAFALFAAMALPACVQVRHVDDTQLPAAWRREIERVGTFRDPSGRYQDAGQALDSRGVVNPTRLANVFFPGHLDRRTAVEAAILAWNGTDRLTVTLRHGERTVLERTFAAEVDRPGGWLNVGPIEVKDTEKFGAVASTQSARLALGSDGALYLKMRTHAAGVVLFVPAAGTATRWTRFHAAKP